MISPLKKQTSLTTITIAGQNKAKKNIALLLKSQGYALCLC